MSDLDIQEVLAINKKLEEENEKLRKTNEGVHVISQAFAESRREGEKLKGTIRILTQQLSSVSSASLGSTKSINASQTESEQLSDETLLDLAGHIGQNWRSLAFRLDIQTVEVDEVQQKYESPKEQVYQILQRWKRKQGANADRAQLMSALERTGRGDLVEMLKKKSSSNDTVPPTCVIPWFVDIVALEMRNKWRALADELKVTEFDIIVQLPAEERIYGLFDNWLKVLEPNVDPVPLLIAALSNSGRSDIAEKVFEASNARKYMEEWSMHQPSIKDTEPESMPIESEDTLNDVPSLKHSTIQPGLDSSLHPVTDNDNKDDSVRSFATQESMNLNQEPESTGSQGDPEEHTSLSLQLRDIEKFCRTYFGSSELTNGLAKMLPKSIEQDKELKQLRTLRHATIDQNKRLKDELEEKNQMIADLRLESHHLKKELEETKKVKQDENLRSFEVVTTGDAYALKKEEKLNVEMKQGAAASDVKPEDRTTSVIANLRTENRGLKKQIDEILKVNNEWDQQYAGMKASFEAKLKKLEEDKQRVKEDLDRKLNECIQNQSTKNQAESILDKKQREFDQMLTQAKSRIDAIELEKDEHQKRSARLERWVHQLLLKKNENEAEIQRLNQELEQSMQNIHPPREFEMHRGAPSYGMQIPRVRDDDVERRMQEQVDLLQQQNMAFQSDFNQERRDRQHVAGKLAEAEEELKNLREIAKDLQDQVNAYENNRRVKRPPNKSYIIHEVPRPRRKLTKRGVNYGGNDVYIDGDIEVDDIDGKNVPDNAESECPMCQIFIDNKQDLERHVERCTNNFD